MPGWGIVCALAAAAATSCGPGGGFDARRRSVLAAAHGRKWPMPLASQVRVPRRRRPRAATAARQVAAPLVLDLVAAAIAAGSSPDQALQAVLEALPDDATVRLRPVCAALALGSQPSLAWAGLLDDETWRPLAVAMSRATEAGGQVAELLRAMASDRRAIESVAATEAARRAGVRAVLPLGVCFLPAFVLLGIVPTVVALASAAFGSQ